MAEPQFAKDISALLTPEELGTMSGLEFLRRIAAGDLPQPPIGRAMNYRLVEVEPGSAHFEGTPEFDQLNPLGTVHGGWFGTLLDSCMACAVQTRLPQGSGYTTLEYKINILRPILAGSGRYRAIGKTDHVGRRTGVAHGEIRGLHDDKLYATGNTTCLIFPLPKAL